MKKETFRKFITRGHGKRQLRDRSQTGVEFLGTSIGNSHKKPNEGPLQSRPKGGVHWGIQLPDRVPVTTTIIQIEKERRQRTQSQGVPEKKEPEVVTTQRRFSRAYIDYDDRKEVKELRQPDVNSYLFEDDTPVDSSQRSLDESPPSSSQSSHSGPVSHSENTSRDVKVRLNSAHRAKINEFGLSFVFALNADEKMRMRRNRFRTNNPPVIPVNSTLASDLKEVFHGYCGRRKRRR